MVHFEPEENPSRENFNIKFAELEKGCIPPGGQTGQFLAADGKGGAMWLTVVDASEEAM